MSNEPTSGRPAPSDDRRPGDVEAPTMAMGHTEPPSLAGPALGPLLAVPLIAGAAVAVVLGVYGRLHEPGKFALNLAGFSGPGYVKAWLTTLAMILGVVQLLSALSLSGRLGNWSPPWIGTVHRWSGRVAVLLTVPVAVHCLYALGFEYDRARVLIHSVAGCLFYGAFVTKMLSLSRRGLPGWVLPVVGGLVFAALTVLWLSSALWLFNDQGVHL